MARPEFEPTKDQRETVELLSIAGCFTHADIAKHLKISEPTLRKHFANELEGALRGLLKVATGNLRSLLRSEDEKIKMTTTFFVLKTRAKWKETGEAETAEPLPTPELVPNNAAKTSKVDSEYNGGS